MVSKKSMSSGTGIAFHVPSAKMKKVRVNLTPRQSLVLRKGGAVTIKAITDNGTHEISLPEIDVKKLLTKLQKGVGGRIKLNGGSVESMFRDAASWAAPVANAAQDRAIREIGRGLKKKGGSVESMFRDAASWAAPVANAAQDRAIRELGRGIFETMTPVKDKMRVRPAVMPNKDNLHYFTPEELVKYGYKGSGVKKRGRPRKGKGMFDFLDPKKNGAEQFFTKTLPNNLVDVGIPIVTGAMGSAAGAATGNPLLGMAGSYAGKQAGEAAARRIRKAQGRGVLTDLAMEVGKRVAKKAISYAGKKARQGATHLIHRAEAYGNDMVGDGIYPAGVGSGILPAGVNLRRGGGLGTNDAPIQTGVPYLQNGAPGWKPYVASQNPFATNTLVMRQPKHGGKIVRV